MLACSITCLCAICTTQRELAIGVRGRAPRQLHHRVQTQMSQSCLSDGLQGELYIIDVSQSVELDHPRALGFLREVLSETHSLLYVSVPGTVGTCRPQPSQHPGFALV